MEQQKIIDEVNYHNGIVFQISGFAAREKNTFISKTLQKVIDRFAGEPKITSDISC